MTKKKYHPYLKAFSGLSINISAGWLIAPFIGTNISFPDNLGSLIVLIADIILGILFLLITVWCERKLER